ncbi:MAG TPA: serine/threonine-protein kinase, partial [Myxococcota bacterium]|nr:serine/threonine-protein kinase [Myxococcota bacterium]
METPRHTDPYEGQTLLGRYEVRRRLGAGGTATVYLAIQEPIGREVAIKILRADLAGPERGNLADRLVREAQLIARLSNPHIVTVYDCGKLPDEAVYVVMERIKGEPLTSLLVGPLEAERAVRIALGLAEALRHAHRSGVIHRDLKPSNVLMTRADDGTEIPKLVDFGIGKGINESDETTIAGRFLGTPQYASPEQAMGLAEVDGRTDIYALGCLMYRMLAGVLPFEADTAMGVAYKQVHAPWPPMASRSAAIIDPALEAIVQRCMEKKPEDRWPDADALIGALKSWQNREPTPPPLSRPVPPLALRSMETPVSIATAAVLPPPEPVAPPRRSVWPLVAAAVGLVGI